MESSTSAVNWQPVNVAKRPGELLLDSLRHVARGSDTVGFFQWRASGPAARSTTRRWCRTPGRTRPGSGRWSGSARRCRGSARSPAAGCRPTSPCSGTGRRGGPPSCPRTRATCCATPTPRCAGTGHSPAGRDRRRPAPGRRPVRLPARGGAHAVPLLERRRGRPRRVRARRRARPGHLLLRHRRRGRPRSARRLPGRLPRSSWACGSRSSHRCRTVRRSAWTTAAAPICGPSCCPRRRPTWSPGSPRDPWPVGRR